MFRSLEMSVWDPFPQGRTRIVFLSQVVCVHMKGEHVSEHFVNSLNVWLSQVTGTGNGTRTGTGTGIGTGS